MTSKLKKLKDLERKLDVSLLVEDYKAKFDSKISKIKGTAKLDGFRKGKVPIDVLEQRYGPSVHADVINELIQDSYPKELAEINLSQHVSHQLVLKVMILLNLLSIQQYLKFFLKLKLKFLDGLATKNIQ